MNTRTPRTSQCEDDEAFAFEPLEDIHEADLPRHTPEEIELRAKTAEWFGVPEYVVDGADIAEYESVAHLYVDGTPEERERRLDLWDQQSGNLLASIRKECAREKQAVEFAVEDRDRDWQRATDELVAKYNKLVADYTKLRKAKTVRKPKPRYSPAASLAIEHKRNANTVRQMRRRDPAAAKRFMEHVLG